MDALIHDNGNDGPPIVIENDLIMNVEYKPCLDNIDYE